MAKIGRNQPCPCGSGKKHKRCCGAVAAPSPPPTNVSSGAGVQPHHELCPCCVDELDERADRVADELIADHLDEAEALCHQLIADFPGEAEGLDLLSMIFEQRGLRDQALDLLRRASQIAHARPDYDNETRSIMRQRMSELQLSA